MKACHFCETLGEVYVEDSRGWRWVTCRFCRGVGVVPETEAERKALPEMVRWVFCLHCSRAYRRGEYRLVRSRLLRGFLRMCPFEGCDGDTVLDAIPWPKVLLANSSLPLIPERGKVYSLWGDSVDVSLPPG